MKTCKNNSLLCSLFFLKSDDSSENKSTEKTTNSVKKQQNDIKIVGEISKGMLDCYCLYYCRINLSAYLINKQSIYYYYIRLVLLLVFVSKL